MKAPIFLSISAATALAGSNYAIVVSQDTLAQPEWRQVVEALEGKYPGAGRVEWTKEVGEARESLRQSHPRMVAFVARPGETGAQFVRAVNRLTREFDDDPYTDTLWGIVTGFDAANALEIARESKPLVVRHVVSATEIALDRCESAAVFSELKAGERVRKDADGNITAAHGPADSADDIAKALEDPRAELFITSGHATERDWQPGYSYRNGTWHSKGGELMTRSLAGVDLRITSPHAKIYLPIGNCLMGHINGTDAMALAFMKSAGVRQMTGYVVPTWYGYQGWGALDYFVEQPGRFTLSEAFIANQHALIHRLATYFPDLVGETGDAPRGRPSKPVVVGEAAKAAGLKVMDGQGLLHDRDVVAFYGDPGWEARMRPGLLNWVESWRQDAGGATLEITPKAGQATFAPVNTNGSQRGGRPILRFFERRIDPASVKITAGAEFKPVITDDFLLVPLPDAAAPVQPIRIAFTADPAGK